MNIIQRFAVILTILFTLTPTNGVFARTTATNHLPALNQWSSYGLTTVGTETVTLTGGSSGWVYVDLDVSKLSGSSILIASHANKVDARTYDVTTRRSSGNPYLYAYQMDSNKTIKKYLTGDLTTTSSRSDSDRVVYGIFPIETNVSIIRIFLMQSAIKNISNSGVNVTFMKPVLVSTSSKSASQDVLNAYAQGTLDLNQGNAVVSTSTVSSTTTTTNKPSCAPSGSIPIATIGFEDNETSSSKLSFGSSLAQWVYGGSHDYYASAMTPYSQRSSEQRYNGSYALKLLNSGYGYVNGVATTSPQTYEESLRYSITGSLTRNQTYRFAARARFVRGTASTSTINLTAGYEIGEDGEGTIRQSQQTSVGDEWTCVSLDFKNRGWSTTKQSATIYFGALPKGGTLFLDEVSLSKI